ncbi:HU family DNA-binding protein [Niveispirillum sp. KHB5.9]|uniref:HU family DNA-binding protein n=1 Tax=Niveispirillum sp. KHB5.9 TaxID=3400269 RepID=UPI003A89A2B0
MPTCTSDARRADEDWGMPVQSDGSPEDLPAAAAVATELIDMKNLVAALSVHSGYPKEVVSAVLLSFKAFVADAMVKGSIVDMGRDFGKFETVMIASRNHHVPATGAIMMAGRRRKMRFRPSSKSLKTLPLLGD